MMRAISLFLLFSDRQNFVQPVSDYDCKMIIQTGAQPLFEVNRMKTTVGLIDLFDHIIVKYKFDAGFKNSEDTFQKCNLLIKRKSMYNSHKFKHYHNVKCDDNFTKKFSKFISYSRKYSNWILGLCNR